MDRYVHDASSESSVLHCIQPVSHCEGTRLSGNIIGVSRFAPPSQWLMGGQASRAVGIAEESLTTIVGGASALVALRMNRWDCTVADKQPLEALRATKRPVRQEVQCGSFCQ